MMPMLLMMIVRSCLSDWSRCVAKCLYMPGWGMTSFAVTGLSSSLKQVQA